MEIPISRILDDLALADPTCPLVTCAGTTATRVELATRSNRLARAYERLGVKVGDMVTIVLPNSIEFYAASFCDLETRSDTAASLLSATRV